MKKIQDFSIENFNQLNDDLDYICRLYSKVGKILEKKMLERSYELDDVE